MPTFVYTYVPDVAHCTHHEVRTISTKHADEFILFDHIVWHLVGMHMLSESNVIDTLKLVSEDGAVVSNMEWKVMSKLLQRLGYVV